MADSPYTTEINRTLDGFAERASKMGDLDLEKLPGFLDLVIETIGALSGYALEASMRLDALERRQ